MFPPGLTTAEVLAAAKAVWKPTPHPFLPWFSDEELIAAIFKPQGPQRVADLYNEREHRIWLASDEGDPFYYGFELPHWKDADDLINKVCDLIYVAGGKRAGKSEWAAKRVVQAAMKYPKGVIWCFQDNHPTSVATQQKLIWKYLPWEIKSRNGKQDKKRIAAINYTPKNGFADGVLVLPNGTAIHFLTYNSEVTDYQGWEIGAYVSADKLDPNIPNIGAWADENLPLQWLETILFRATTRSAKVLWTFSTTQGITTTIKEVLGTPITEKARFAELLANRQNLTELEVGQMPYIQRCSRPRTYAIYFHSDLNMFGDNYANVKALCHGKPSAFIEENAYGYARDVMHKAFPLFSGINIVPRAKIPVKGTNYFFTDPGDGSRNWASLWVRVCPGGVHYIYRDWPDCQSYGEWAVPSEDPKQPDGDRGPAQRSLGFGTEQFAAEWRGLEGKEEIFDRYVDSRASSVKHIEEHGGTNIIEKFAALAQPMYFQPASGQEKSVGFAHVNSLLWWDKEKPLCADTNRPKLYVCEDCLQVIWTMQNYTDRGGEKGGSKDFADLLRYMALADLQYYENNELKSYGGKGGY